MMTTTLASQLIEVMAGDGFAVRTLRDWEWFQGFHLTPKDFCPAKIDYYLRALRELLTAEEISRVETTIEAIWRKGYARGLLATRPVRLRVEPVDLILLGKLEHHRHFVL